jgi:hypothetical protein
MHDTEFMQLESLVNNAEKHRTAKNTAAIQQYVVNHPDLSLNTLHLTNEIKQRLMFYMASGDKEREGKIREELDAIKASIDALNEKGNILFALLSEEIQLSYLMLRFCDVSSARHNTHLSSGDLRRADAAHVRFLRSLRCLATLQKMGPQININVAKQQIINNN